MCPPPGRSPPRFRAGPRPRRRRPPDRSARPGKLIWPAWAGRWSVRRVSSRLGSGSRSDDRHQNGRRRQGPPGLVEVGIEIVVAARRASVAGPFRRALRRGRAARPPRGGAAVPRSSRQLGPKGRTRPCSIARGIPPVDSRRAPPARPADSRPSGRSAPRARPVLRYRVWLAPVRGFLDPNRMVRSGLHPIVDVGAEAQQLSLAGARASHSTAVKGASSTRMRPRSAGVTSQ